MKIRHVKHACKFLIFEGHIQTLFDIIFYQFSHRPNTWDRFSSFHFCPWWRRLRLPLRLSTLLSALPSAAVSLFCPLFCLPLRLSTLLSPFSSISPSTPTTLLFHVSNRLPRLAEPTSSIQEAGDLLQCAAVTGTSMLHLHQQAGSLDGTHHRDPVSNCPRRHVNARWQQRRYTYQ